MQNYHVKFLVDVYICDDFACFPDSHNSTLVVLFQPQCNMP